MASIKKRPDGKWRARYRDHAGKEHARHFDRKVDAQAWLDEVIAAMVTGRYVDPRAGKLSLKAYAAAWEAAQVARDAQTRLIDNALRLHILPKLGDRQLDSLRRSDVQALVKTWSLTLSPGSVRNHYSVLQRLLADAVQDRIIAESPCQRIALPAEADEELVIPTVEDIQRLAGEVPDRYRALVLLLAGSGLRIGEALGLQTPADVVSLRREIHVRRQRLQSGELGPPKTERARRTVRMAPWLRDELSEHLVKYPAHPDGFLFTTSRGNPLTYTAWRSVWNTARRNLGLEHISAHDLRHAYASALIAGGATVKQVQLALGHESPMITLRTYTHLWPGDEDRTAAIIERTFAVLRTGCGPADPSRDESAGQEAGKA